MVNIWTHHVFTWIRYLKLDDWPDSLPPPILNLFRIKISRNFGCHTSVLRGQIWPPASITKINKIPVPRVQMKDCTFVHFCLFFYLIYWGIFWVFFFWRNHVSCELQYFSHLILLFSQTMKINGVLDLITKTISASHIRFYSSQRSPPGGIRIINKNMTYLPLTKTSQKKDRPLVIIYGWLLAKAKHVHK